MTTLYPWHLTWRDEVTSTMDEIKPLLEAPGFVALCAGIQTQGRGRRGHGWTSHEGNVFLSCAFPLDLPEPRLPEWAFGAGVALARTCRLYLQAVSCTLKWPNDLLIEDKKIAGLLIEAYTNPATQSPWVILGAGVNLAHSPDLENKKTTSLSRVTHTPPTRQAFVETFLAQLSHLWDLWHTQGFEAVRRAWLELAHPVGTPLHVHKSTGALYGTFLDLDPHGRLLLELENGERVFITAADVFIGEQK
jgi:BirA family transcriptional regulator, biotin operon repressor / biotin---[acetyl-CoA-carboxylase] ligase